MSRRGENIYKRADGRYEGRYVISRSSDGKRKYGYIYGKKYADVKERLTEKKAQYACVQKADDLFSPYFRSLAYQWEMDFRFSRLKPSTKQKYRQMLENHILPFWEDRRINDIQEKDVREFVSRLVSGGLSRSYIRDILRLMKKLLEETADKQILTNMPKIKSEIPEDSAHEITVLSKEEQKRLQQFAEEADLPILLSLYTGLRLGEICALQWRDIDWYYQTLTVERTVQRLRTETGMARTNLVVSAPKSRTSFRTVPLPHFLIQSLENQWNACHPEAYIFGSESRPADPRKIQARFQRLLKRASLPHIRFHCLRHSFTTRLLEIGVDIKTVSSLLGHSSVRTTMEIYAHSQMETKRSAVDLLEETMHS